MNKFTTPFLLSFLLLSCAGTKTSDSNVGSRAKDNMNFYQHWIHSYEEQNGNKKINIFRPASSQEFPPSHFRMEFSFNQSGQCHYKFLSPTDQHEMRKCVYTKIEKKIYIYNDAGKLLPHLSFTLIEKAKSNIMRMSYGIQTNNTKTTSKSKKT